MRLFLYTPSPSLGGTETLALRISEELRRREIKATLVTENGGWLQINAKQIGLETLSIDKFVSTTLAENDYVISSAKYLFDKNLTHCKSKTLFWILHPLEFIWTRHRRLFRFYEYFHAKHCGLVFKFTSPIYFRELRDNLAQLTRENRLISMSKDCIDFTNRFLGTSIEIPILSLPTPKINVGFDVKITKAPVHGIAYFGRIEQFKTASIKRLISDYAKCHYWKGKTLTLFGFGAAEEEILNFAKTHGVSIEITGKLTTKEVVDRAQRDKLVVFTMGLSGLDLLCANIPAVFLPVPRSARDEQGSYAFLSHLPDGCVGSYPEFLDNSQGKTFLEITELCLDGRIWDIFRQDKIRIAQQHDLVVTVDQLLKITATYSISSIAHQHN